MRSLRALGCTVMTTALFATLAAASVDALSRQALKHDAKVTARAFGRLLHRRYGTFHGYWTCPVGQLIGTSEIGCTAEFKRGGSWFRVSAVARATRRPVTFHYMHSVSWVRSWSAYTHSIVSGFGAKGVASVNTPDEDWSFLAGGMYYDWKKHRRNAVLDDYDGDGNGLTRFYWFNCHFGQTLVSCHNSFGDAIRYRPRG